MTQYVRVLGPLSVDVADAPVPIRGRLKRALLADLALHPNQVLSIDRLVEDLWPASPPRDPGNTIQVHVGQLRRLLEPERGSRAPATLLVSEPTGYALRADKSSLDSLAFDAAVVRGRALAAANFIVDAADQLSSGLDLWTGDPLPDIADLEFARGPLTRLREARVAALEARIDLDLRLGRHAEVAAELEVLAEAHPLRERLWELRMLALHRSGRSAEALRVFQHVRRTLGEELGVQPSTRLVDLDRAITTDDPALTWTPARRAKVGREPPAADEEALAGRVDELARLIELLEAAGSGGHRVALVLGEAGAGKTRLVAELADRAWARGARVVSSRCSEGEAAPLAPLLDVLTQLVRDAPPEFLRPDVAPAAAVAARLSPSLHEHFGPLAEPTPLPPEEERTRLFDAIARLIVASVGDTPTVAVVDDVHWADPTTLGLLTYVARATAGVPLLLILAYRPTDVLDDRVRRALITLERDPAADKLSLGPLGEQAATQMVGRIAGADIDRRIVAAIVARAAGNPFFLRELAREAAGGNLDPTALPAAARDLVLARIERLHPPARHLAAAAAAFEGPFSLSVAAVAGGLDERTALDALDDLIAAGIALPAAPDECAFTHDLVRQSLYDSLSSPRRARLHRAIAEAMETTEAATVAAAAVIARHYRNSAMLDGAVRGAVHAERAAAAAEAAHAYAEAASMLELTLQLGEQTEIERGRLLLRLGRARLGARSDEVAAAEALVDGAALLAPDDRSAAADALSEAATFAFSVGAADAARRLAEGGLAYADDTDDAWGALKLIHILATGLADSSWPGIVLATPETDRVAAALRRIPADRRPSMASTLLLAFASREDALAIGAGDPAALVYWAGEYELALPLTRAMARACEDEGRIEFAIVHSCAEARCLNALGRFVEADTVLERTITLLPRLTRPSLYVSHVMSLEEERWAAIGAEWGMFRVDVRPYLDPRVERWYAAALNAAAARVLANLGAHADALRRLERVVDIMDTAPGWTENYLRIVHAAAEVLWLTGCEDHVALVERNAREKLLEPDFRYPMTDLRLTLGRLAATGGRPDEALDWFGRARAALDQQGAVPLRLIVDHDAAIVAMRMGRRGHAGELLAHVAEQASALGMHGWADRARGELTT